jgi:hypothetical protein
MANQDDFVRVAPDSTGKLVDMGTRQSLATDPTTGLPGTTVKVQRAEMVGESGDAIIELNENTKKLLAVMRAVLFVLSDGNVTEEQFLE